MKTDLYRTPGGLALTVRRPEGANRVPVIVLCHGFGGVQNLLLPSFAEAFVSSGYAAVTFDYRGFGDSDGEKGRLVPSMQIDDIQAAIAFVSQLEHIDADRLALWGTSLGAGHVIAVAALDRSIKAVVSQLGFADGEYVVSRNMTASERDAFEKTLERMQEKKESTGREMFVAMTKVLTDTQSKAFVEANRTSHPALEVKIPFLTIREMLRYKPKEAAARVTCPVLVVVAAEDIVNPPEQGLALYEAIGSPEKQLHIEESAGHYDIYQGRHFESCIAKQIQWYREHL
jgi:pimeloyl-ACP methyl ester carboxylesterase